MKVQGYDTEKECRIWLRGIPSDVERKQLEKTAGCHFNMDASRGEILLARMMLQAQVDPEARKFLPELENFVQWLIEKQKDDL